MKFHRTLIGVAALSATFTFCACGGRQTDGSNVPQEVVLRASDLTADTVTEEASTSVDTLANGPFNNRVSYLKDDNNGGYENYTLQMNLYEGNIPDGNGSLCYGILTLTVKSPDSLEGVEISRRLITAIHRVEGHEAEVVMSDNAELPNTFSASLRFDEEAHTYELLMKADPNLVEDLMENRLVMQ